MFSFKSNLLLKIEACNTVIYMKIERFHTWLLKAFCNLIGLVKKGVQESEGEAKIRSQKAISKLCC